MMKIVIYGAGYVGLVSAVGFAKMGHQVVCVDIDEARVEMLNNGISPIYESQLPELLQEQIANKHLRFTHEISEAIHQGSIHIVATGTPSSKDGSADLSQVCAVVTQIANEVVEDALIVIKSTVPVGTGDN